MKATHISPLATGNSLQTMPISNQAINISSLATTISPQAITNSGQAIAISSQATTNADQATSISPDAMTNSTQAITISPEAIQLHIHQKTVLIYFTNNYSLTISVHIAGQG